MRYLKYFFRILFRFAVLWLVDGASLLVTTLIIPGIRLTAVDDTPAIVVAVAAALLLGIVNLIVRPLILLLALPFGFFALFAVGFVINAITLSLTAAILPGFDISSWVAAFFGGLVLAASNTLITSFLTIDDDDQFYQGLVERLASRQSFPQAQYARRGLVMIEIDGLSYWHMKKAISEGWMPMTAALITKEGYELSRVDCGLPSQTSACQAGIMFGENFDIPAFRWYDKSAQRLLVSGRDAALLNERYAHGMGLLRGGSSINNMLDGDAEKSLLTLANLRSGSPDEQHRRAQDMYLMMLNPYFMMRIFVLFIAEMLVEIGQALRQRLRKTWPRLNRLAHFYPVLRASTTVFMREVATYLLVLDIIRGSPSIYMTWPGYDEVAHHSGPWTQDAFSVLRKFDRVIARVLDIIERKAPIPYELILLSDHGQSFGATFYQRYNTTLKEFIEQHLPEGTPIMQTAGGDDGTLSVRAMAAEIENIQDQGLGGRVGKGVMRQTNKVLARGAARQELEDIQELQGVIVCGSGNLAQVYFDTYPRRLTLDELEQAYPGMVQALVNHDGVGFVVAYQEAEMPVVLGKGGSRDLISGQVTGVDPLAAYGDPLLRAAQVARLASFPNAGDLIVNSTLYPDGTVAAMEELIGNHGGLGGEQTDAFLFHPPDMDVPQTQNATEIFPILNSRRSLLLPKIPSEDQELETRRVSDWSNSVLVEGLQQFETWLSIAAHALWLDRGAYQSAARDPYMTGPAILVVILMMLVTAWFDPAGSFWEAFLVRLALWPLLVLIMYAAARLVGGKGTYTQTLRGMSFGLMGNVVLYLTVITPLELVARLAALVLSFLGAWIGVNAAHHLSGWRVWVIPVAALFVLVVSAGALTLLVTGTAFTLELLLLIWLGFP